MKNIDQETQKLMAEMPHTEIVKASTYYGWPTPGYCILVDGRIHSHIFGKSALREAKEDLERLKALWVKQGIGSP